jgi:2-methylcitrate dehydratase PrpD
MLHAAATILPVALAAAEHVGGVSGKQFLEAMIAGIDVSARLSLATLPAQNPRTMSLTYQTGILAGALTAARIAGLSAADMRNVLGVAYSQCAGNQQALYEGADTVRVQQGLSAMTAIISLELAMAGVRGVESSLSGKAGWFAAFQGGRCNLDALTGDLGARFEIDNLSVKPFPCCQYTHTAISAAIAARRDPRFDLDRIERVVAHVNSHECFKIVCEPQDFTQLREALAGPNGRVRAQFSLVHMVATALCHGNVEVRHLDADQRNDAATLALTKRIRAVIDPDKARDQLPVPGIIEIFLKGDDTPIRSVCTVPPGHPDNRMDFNRIIEKYAGVQSLHRQGPSGDTPIDMIRGLETLEDIAHLVTALEEKG